MAKVKAHRVRFIQLPLKENAELLEMSETQAVWGDPTGVENTKVTQLSECEVTFDLD